VRTVFPGFPPEALQFFRGLARHNNRDWFQPRKTLFEEQVKQPMLALVEALNGELRKFAPAYVTDPGKSHLPHLSRYALQQGQDALQGPHRRELPSPHGG
jgi:uncharacterized protein (DUF2461 family)